MIYAPYLNYLKMNTEDDIIPKEILKNRSGWIDSIFGHVRTDEWDSFYENLPTKLSRKFHNNIKFIVK